MKIEIKHRYTNAVLWSGEAVDLREGVKIAVSAKADLRGANLSYADLRDADLRGANLRYANLYGADLGGAKSGSVCRMDFDGWSICIREDKTSIGCKTYPNADWLKWTPKDVAGFETNAEPWWKLHGPAVKAAIEVVMQKAKLNEKGGEK